MAKSQKKTVKKSPVKSAKKKTVAKAAPAKKKTAKTVKKAVKTTVVKKPVKKKTPVAKPAPVAESRAPKSSRSVPEGPQHYIVLPSRGLRAEGREQRQFFQAMNAYTVLGGPVLESRGAIPGAIPQPKMQVVDSIDDSSGAKLVEMHPNEITALRMQDPGARVVPEVFYDTCEVPEFTIETRIRPEARTLSVAMSLEVVRASDGAAVEGAKVVAFTNFEARSGAEGKTGSNGKVSLNLGDSSVKIQRLYIYPPAGLWGHFKKNITLQSGKQFKLQPITFPVSDALEQFYGAGQLTDGAGVKIAVLDTGVGPHPDLQVVDGENTVLGAVSTQFHDNGDMHGTHVAGIIAARGTAPTGRTGVAPGASIYSYRVFERGKKASNFAIAKAIDRAVVKGCHIINMSLGGGTPDPVIGSAIADARNMGVAVIVAAGNDFRKPVAFPGNDARAIAVSAMGREGTFPKDTIDSSSVLGPAGKNGKDFIADFSNIGSEIAVTGLGVGIVSTVLGGYAVMSGTSMACPAVVGLTARRLSQKPDILRAQPDQARSDAIISELFAAAQDMGFTAVFQGHGLPQ